MLCKHVNVSEQTTYRADVSGESVLDRNCLVRLQRAEQLNALCPVHCNHDVHDRDSCST